MANLMLGKGTKLMEKERDWAAKEGSVLQNKSQAYR